MGKPRRVRKFNEDGVLTHCSCGRCKRLLPVKDFGKRAPQDGFGVFNQCYECCRAQGVLRYYIKSSRERRRQVEETRIKYRRFVKADKDIYAGRSAR